MEFQFIRKNKKCDEKSFLFFMLGVCEALDSGAITLDEAERVLFFPGRALRLTELKLNRKIVDIVREGCFLEDLLDWLPNCYNDEICKIKKKILVLIKKRHTFNKAEFCVIFQRLE